MAGDLTQPTYQLNVSLAALAAFMITGAGNTINDVYDIEIDRVNAPNRPLPSGQISLYQAKTLSITLFAAGVLLSITINIICFLIALINSIVLFYYAKDLKRIPFAGNAAVGVLVGSTFLFGGAAVEGLTIASILFVLAGTATLGREVAKDIEDIEGDKGVARTIATELGVKKASTAAVIPTIIAVLMSPFPFTLGIFGVEYLLLVMAANIVFLAGGLELYLNQSVEAATRFQRKSKLAMFLALASFIVGSLM
ncbi:UbiA family prenyltransferase [Methanonatronarchaeum sp. AMET6-2]|nr:UbiA family prenyltransferase [Methanonatronarchaeum sp. AMET6-2]